MSRSVDLIVIGCGAVGGAAAWRAAERGLSVRGFDRFAPPHDRGSSHGQTRLTRLSYFEHPDHVPLLLRSFDLWAELEAGSGRRVYHETGLLEIGPEDGVVVPGVLKSAAEHGLAVEKMTEDDFRREHPGFRLPEGSSVVHEAKAGCLLVEDAVGAQLELARRGGAEIVTNEEIVGWSADGDGVVVETSSGLHRAGGLVVSAGAWASDSVAGLGVDLRVVEKHLHWFSVDGDGHRLASGSPCFLHERPEGLFYGFPDVDGTGVKVAEHSGGRELADPSERRPVPDPDDDARVLRYVEDCLSGVSARRTRHVTCLYTMSPDELFIVDRHPLHEQVALAAGLSGHGFKFAPVLGEVLVDLAMTGQSEQPIEFLGLSRFS